MKFFADCDLFRRTLERVIRASAPTSPIPILSQVRISTWDGHVGLACTNDELEITGEFEANVSTHGAVCVPAKKLLSILSRDGSVSFSAKAQAIVSIGKSLYKLPCVDSEEFPSFPVGVGGDTRLDWGTFSVSLKRVLPATAKESAGNPVLTGVEIRRTPRELRLTATDAHVMVRCSLPQDEWLASEIEQVVVIPKAAALELSKLPHADAASFATGESVARFEVGDYHLTCCLLAAPFPNCESVLNRKVKGGFITNREDLIAAVKRLQSMSQDDFNRVTLTFEDTVLKVGANAKDLGEGIEELECRRDLQNAIVTLHSEQLLSLLQVWGGDEIAFGYESWNKPLHLYPMNTKSYVGVMMPLVGNT